MKLSCILIGWGILAAALPELSAQERKPSPTPGLRAVPRPETKVAAPTNAVKKLNPQVGVRHPPEATKAVTRDPAKTVANPNLQPATRVGRTERVTSVQLNDALLDARRARQRGDGLQAVEALNRADTIARELPNKDAEAGVALEKAQTLERFGRIKASPEWKNEAMRNYTRALEIGNPSQKTAARNNLGAFWVQERDYAKAISTLAEVNPETIPPAQRAAYRYNLGRAHELSEHSGAAWTNYWQAWKADPTFHKPAEGCFRLALTMNPPRLAQLTELATNLMARGQVDLPLGYVREGLTNFPSHPDAPLLLEALLRAYIVTGLTPQTFAETERPLLNSVAERSPTLKPFVLEIGQAFEGKLPAAFREADAHRLFRAWGLSLRGRVAMSDLLKAVGDAYARSANNTNGGGGEAEKALGRYACAWTLNLENTSAALYAAALMNDHKALDPDGARLRQFTETLFELKGNSYRVPYKTEADWLNILRCHLVLGSIYERTRVWGHESDVTSAIFQLSRALAAEENILKLNPQFSPSPRLYARLANAYQQARRPQDAWKMYVRAAEAFLHYTDRASATESVTRARNLGVTVNPTDLARLEKVETALR